MAKAKPINITDRDRLLSSPRALKVEGGPEWCIQVLEGLRWAYTRLDSDWAYVEKLRGDLAAHRAWEKVPPDGPAYGSEDAMLREVIGVSAATLNVQVVSVKERAERPALLRENRRPTNEERDDNRANNTVIRGSTNADYLTARIARDRPDILERMKAGEFPSVRQAGIAAGIVRVPTGLDALRRAWGKATDEERATFWRAIAAQLAASPAEGEASGQA